MDRVLLPYYYNLGAALGRLVAIPMVEPVNAAPDEKFLPWSLGNAVHTQLLWLYRVDGPLKVPNVAHEFQAALQRYGESIGFPVPGQPPSNVPEAVARSDLIVKCLDLQAVVLADLQRMPIYSVPKQGAYDTDDLIDNADAVLPVEVRVKLSQLALDEIKESGRCLAYGVATASGFHMMRAVEDVLRYYCATVTVHGVKGQKIELPKTHVPSWGDYTAYLEHSKEADVIETRALLHPLGKNQRDFIAHPEKVLTPNEAYSLFQEGQAAINRMADRIT
jgi:hypothetical protein